MAFLALHAEFAHLSQHIVFHEKALKHIALWGHKHAGNQHNQTYSENTPQHVREENDKCNNCNVSSKVGDEDEDENMKVHKNHNHHNHHHSDGQHYQHSNSEGIDRQKADEQNDDQKQKNDSSEESSEEQESRSTKVTVVETTSETVHNSHQNEGNVSSKFLSNGPKRTHFEHEIHERMRINSMDNDFKKWFEKMLNDIHKKSYHMNKIHVTVNSSENVSGIHSHHIHVHSNADKNTQKQIEDNLQDMERFLTSEDLIFATCEVRPNRHIALLNQQDIRGRINLWQQKANRGPLHMHIKLKGFKVTTHDHRPPVREVRETVLMPVEQEPDETSITQRITASHTHGFHVHEYGNLTRDCQSVGGHYNPLNLLHGGPYDVIRHVGDLGNIRCDDNGETDIELAFSQVSLSGEHSIINRSIVIHNNGDDYGRNPKNPASAMTGSSGVRIACCIIEEVKQLPKEVDSQSKVAPVAAPTSNKRRREVSPNHYRHFSELFKEFAKYGNGHKYQSLFERRTSRKGPKFSRE